MNGNCTVVDVRDNVCTAPVNTCDITGIHQSISLTSRIYMIIKQWVWETAAKEDINTQQNPVFKRYYQTHTCSTKKYILKHDGIFETNGKFAKKNQHYPSLLSPLKCLQMFTLIVICIILRVHSQIKSLWKKINQEPIKTLLKSLYILDY